MNTQAFDKDCFQKPWMSAVEVACITKYLSPSLRVVEWGCGGSTLYFSRHVKCWLSVEHDKAWHHEMSRQLHASGTSNVELLFIPPSPLVKPAHLGPYPPGYLKAFSAYVAAGLSRPFDAALVDGRARLACARAAWQALPDKGLLFFHDFFHPDRKRYTCFLQEAALLDCVREGQTLAVFQK